LVGPLDGLKVIDVGTVLAAPLGATLLADLGEEVIKIEHPRGDSIRTWGVSKNGIHPMWKVINRNKKTVTLNLSNKKGQELFKQLLKDADVVIENFRPGTMDRWGLGFEALKTVNQRIIVVSITGWGQTGLYKNNPGYGTLAEAMSGFAELNGPENGPPTLPPVGFADAIAGLYAAFAVLAAIYCRDVSKKNSGQHVDIGLYEPLYSILCATNLQVTQHDLLGIVPHRKGNRTEFEVPRNLYRTKDGKWISISSTNERMARRIFAAMGMEKMLDDSRFRDNDARLGHAEEVDRVVSDWMARHGSKDILEIFERYEATAGIVYDIKDIFNDPHFRARGNIITVQDSELGKIKMHGVIPVFSETPGAVRHAGLPLGHNNEEIFMDKLGLSKKDLDQLKREGII
jgi:crotonobetainyl-CoA:carnitine CoA-transferase CaiB-like acyl-CoA transferase